MERICGQPTPDARGLLLVEDWIRVQEVIQRGRIFLAQQTEFTDDQKRKSFFADRDRYENQLDEQILVNLERSTQCDQLVATRLAMGIEQWHKNHLYYKSQQQHLAKI